MCGGGGYSIVLLPLVARCLESIDVCIWHMFVLMSVVVTMRICGNVCSEPAVVEDGVLALEYKVCVTDVLDVVFSVYIEAVCAYVWDVLVFCHADVVCVCLLCNMW